MSNQDAIKFGAAFSTCLTSLLKFRNALRSLGVLGTHRVACPTGERNCPCLALLWKLHPCRSNRLTN